MTNAAAEVNSAAAFSRKERQILMKNRFAAIALLIILTFTFSFNSFALSITESTQALNAQFSDGSYSDLLDYVSFSPVKGESDNTEYPLFIWLHGKKSGYYPRAQLENYEISNWASDEYQARFSSAGGCYILAPRVINSDKNSWTQELCSPLKGLIDCFVAENSANIDTDRIYIGGFSIGGDMVWHMITAYPDFFAAAIPVAAISQPAATDLNKLNNMPLWLFTSDHDPYIINETSDVMPNFNYLCGISNKAENLRLTSFSEAFFADWSKKTETVDGQKKPAFDAEHYIWEAVTYDMFMADGITPYACAKTIDSTGNVIEISDPEDGVIRWLSAQSLADLSDAKPLSFFEQLKHIFNRFIEMLREFFSFLL